MGLLIIEQAVSALRAAGFKTQRAYPGSAMPKITQVVAAVQLAEVDFVEKRSTLEAKLLCPHSLGAAACEDAAILAAQALQTAGFCCRIGAVEFDGRTGIFCASCMAFVQEEEQEQVSVNIPFKIGEIAQKWVISFTAQRQSDDMIPEWGDVPWTVRLEQFFPVGATEDRDPEEDVFVLETGTEVYSGCTWRTHVRITELDGIRQIREGTAASRTIK